jgi:DNA-binding MarR family transcriptional regulator
MMEAMARTTSGTALDWPSFHQMRVVLQEHNAQWQVRLPDLTKPQYAVLRAIGAQPGIEQSSAGSAAATDKATLTALLLRLETRGLITREVDPADRRRRLLHLTAAGVRTLKAAVPVVDGITAHLLERLTAAERDDLHRLLTKLAGD